MGAHSLLRVIITPRCWPVHKNSYLWSYADCPKSFYPKEVSASDLLPSREAPVPQWLGRCLAGYAAAPICLLLPGVAVTEGRFALRPPHQTKVPRHNHLGVAQSPKQLCGARYMIASARTESNTPGRRWRLALADESKWPHALARLLHSGEPLCLQHLYLRVKAQVARTFEIGVGDMARVVACLLYLLDFLRQFEEALTKVEPRGRFIAEFQA